jgi:hypothetical protein
VFDPRLEQELHEFLECLIMIAFQRANPSFGGVGHTVEAEFPMPGCLETLLEKCILKNARRDKLAKVKKIVEKDAEVAKVKRERSKALKEQFEKVSMRDATTMTGTKDEFGADGAGSTLGMDVFCDEMSDRVVAEDKKISPTPNITGLFLPAVHCNLSWLDCKGAFVTCQSDASMVPDRRSNSRPSGFQKPSPLLTSPVRRAWAGENNSIEQETIDFVARRDQTRDLRMLCTRVDFEGPAFDPMLRRRSS